MKLYFITVLLNCVSLQGLPGVDAREGIPGIPGAKVQQRQTFIS